MPADTRPSVWKDPNVVDAFKSGRSADDICVLPCPTCGQFSYYNQGSHFTCRHCDVCFYAAHPDEVEYLVDDTYVLLDIVYTMDDVTAAECDDYP